MRHVAYALVGIVSLLAVFCALAGNAQASGMLASAGGAVLATLMLTGPAAAPPPAGGQAHAAEHDETRAGESDHHLSMR